MKKVSQFLMLFVICVSFGCMSDNNKEIYLMPNKYQGVVVVIYNKEHGVDAEKRDGKVIYKIPKNGILITNEKIESSIADMRYYYENEVPSNEIQYCWGCKLSKKRIMIFKGSKGVYSANNNTLDYSVFLVGTKNNEDSLYRVLDNLDLVKLLDESVVFNK